MRAKAHKAVRKKAVQKHTAKSVTKAPTTAPAALSFRARQPDDDQYIIQLTEAQLGGVHQESFGEPFPREQFLHYLQSGAPTVVVEQQNERIGYYSYLVSPDGKMHISAMVIDPKYQSDGIGTKVMTRLEQDAQAHGVHTLEVYVQSVNDKSLAFTRKLGFVEVYPVTPTTMCFQKRLVAVPQQQPLNTVGMTQGIPPGIR